MFQSALSTESNFNCQNHLTYQFIIENEAKATILLPMDFIFYVDHGSNNDTETTICSSIHSIYLYRMPTMCKVLYCCFIICKVYEVFTHIILLRKNTSYQYHATPNTIISFLELVSLFLLVILNTSFSTNRTKLYF